MSYSFVDTSMLSKHTGVERGTSFRLLKFFHFGSYCFQICCTLVHWYICVVIIIHNPLSKSNNFKIYVIEL